MLSLSSVNCWFDSGSQGAKRYPKEGSAFRIIKMNSGVQDAAQTGHKVCISARERKKTNSTPPPRKDFECERGHRKSCLPYRFLACLRRAPRHATAHRMPQPVPGSHLGCAASRPASEQIAWVHFPKGGTSLGTTLAHYASNSTLRPDATMPSCTRDGWMLRDELGRQMTAGHRCAGAASELQFLSRFPMALWFHCRFWGKDEQPKGAGGAFNFGAHSEITPAARLPTFHSGTRLHLGCIFWFLAVGVGRLSRPLLHHLSRARAARDLRLPLVWTRVATLHADERDCLRHARARYRHQDAGGADERRALQLALGRESRSPRSAEIRRNPPRFAKLRRNLPRFAEIRTRSSLRLGACDTSVEPDLSLATRRLKEGFAFVGLTEERALFACRVSFTPH